MRNIFSFSEGLKNRFKNSVLLHYTLFDIIDAKTTTWDGKSDASAAERR